MPSRIRKFLQIQDYAKVVPTPSNTREIFIDLAKTLAVLLMIITHVVAITYDYTRTVDTITYYVGLIGGIGSFSAFLFVSGMNNYYASIAHFGADSLDVAKYHKKIFTKALEILVALVILGILYLIIFQKQYENFSLGVFTRSIYNAFTIGPLPEFSEFLFAFAIFLAAGMFFSAIYQKISKRFLSATVGGVLMYFVGYILFTSVQLPARLNTFVGIFFGKTFEGTLLHTFPVFNTLSYFS